MLVLLNGVYLVATCDQQICAGCYYEDLATARPGQAQVLPCLASLVYMTLRDMASADLPKW